MKRSGVGLLCYGFVLTLVVFGAGCSGGEEESDSGEGVEGMSIRLESTAFEDGEFIPAKYTCDGEDLSPPLRWENVPQGTKSVVIICDDPDAPMGTWVHWVLFDIPADAGGLDEGVPGMASPPKGGTHGANDFKRLGYGGPCPPPGGPHRYFFKIYALDAKLEMKSAVTKATVVKAMKDHVLGEGRLLGKYER